MRMGLSTEVIPVEHWSEFEHEAQRLDGIPERDQTQTGPRLYAPLFRGLANSSWGLETTLERSYPDERSDETLSLRKYYRKIFAAKPAVETFGGKRWDNVPDPPTFGRLLKEHWSGWLDTTLNERPEVYEYLVYLRHHGFPSPLLDWTASPYVAALFAFDMVSKNVDRVCVYALLPRAGGGSSEEHCFFIGPYMRTHQRHFLQQCWYSMCVGRDHASEDYDDYVIRPQEPALADEVAPVEKVLKITIPVKERRVALRQLDLMNINPFSLFGSEDSLVRTVARRECYFKDWRQ